MPSKTPWANPFSGFAEGLESGTKMGLLRRQQNLAEQESLAKAAEAEVKAKREDIAAKFAAAKELQGVRHPAIQKARLNMYATTVKKNAEYFGIDPSAIPDNIEWNDDFTIPLKELDSAFEAWKEGKISDSQGLQALRETMTKMGGVMDSADVEKLRAEKEKQFGEMQQGRALQGASDISTRTRMNPDLVAQTDPAVLEGIESKRMNLLTQGGTAGLAQWKKEMEGVEGGTVKEWTVGDETQYWLTDKQGLPIRRVENFGGARYRPEKVRDAYKANAVLTRIVDKFNADPNVRKFGSMENFATIIVDASLSNNPVAHASLKTLMARASGEVGNLSEADKKPFGGSRALNAKISQYFSEIYSGKKTPENLEFIRQLANTFIETSRKQKEATARVRAKQYAAANKDMFTPDEIFDALSPDSGDYEEKKDTKKSTPSGGKSKEVTFNPQTGRLE